MDSRCFLLSLADVAVDQHCFMALRDVESRAPLIPSVRVDDDDQSALPCAQGCAPHVSIETVCRGFVAALPCGRSDRPPFVGGRLGRGRLARRPGCSWWSLWSTLWLSGA